MDTQTAPEQTRIDGLVSEAAHLAFWLAARIREFLAPAPGKIFEAKALRQLVRTLLLPAEAALRRAIHLMAAELAPLPIRPRPASAPKQPATPAPRPAAPRPPRFRLAEPLPRPKTDYLPESRRPRIRVLIPGPAPLAPVKIQRRPPVDFEARLRRRVAAFEAALVDPVKQARRLQRGLAASRPARPLLAYAKIPGYRSAVINAPGRKALDDINNELVARRLNTS